MTTEHIEDLRKQLIALEDAYIENLENKIKAVENENLDLQAANVRLKAQVKALTPAYTLSMIRQGATATHTDCEACSGRGALVDKQAKTVVACDVCEGLGKLPLIVPLK